MQILWDRLKQAGFRIDDIAGGVEISLIDYDPALTKLLAQQVSDPMLKDLLAVKVNDAIEQVRFIEACQR